MVLTDVICIALILINNKIIILSNNNIKNIPCANIN